MRYPVNNFKTEWNSTAGLGFGAVTSYGFHEGQDINDNGGGDSDLGKEIFTIANGEMVYWHGAKHPTSGFGYHNVYKIVGPWGTRWVHQAHCMPDLTPAPKAVLENERIARVGKSGTGFAHIHFAIFKVDPATLPNGIDTIASTQKQLNDWWEDPIKFIENQLSPSEPMVTIPQKELDAIRKARDDNYNNWQASLKTIAELKTQLGASSSQITLLQKMIDKAKAILNG